MTDERSAQGIWNWVASAMQISLGVRNFNSTRIWPSLFFLFFMLDAEGILQLLFRDISGLMRISPMNLARSFCKLQGCLQLHGVIMLCSVRIAPSSSHASPSGSPVPVQAVQE